MRFEGVVDIKMSREKVWDFLMNMENFAYCIPGLEEFESIDEKTFKSRIKNKVAFMAVKFNATTTISESDPPNSLVAVTKGKDNIIKASVDMKSGFKLELDSDKGTKLTYWTDVNIAGNIASFGESVIRGKAKKI